MDSTKQKEIQQLEKELNNISKEKKGEILLKLSELYWMVSPNKAIEYGKKAIEFYQKRDMGKLSEAYTNTAISFYYQGNVDSTIYYSKKTFHIDNIELPERHLGVSHNILCVAYKRKGVYDSAISHGAKALEYFKTANDSTLLSGTLDNMAQIFEKKGDFEQSLKYSLQSLRIFEKNHNRREMAATQLNISNFYARLKKYNKAKLYLDQALIYAENSDNDYLKADIYNNFGALFYDIKKIDSSYIYYNRALNYYEKAGIKSGIAAATQNIGLVLLKKDEIAKGINLLLKAAQNFKNLNLQDDLSDVYADLGYAYMQNKQYSLAKKYLLRAKHISDILNYTKIQLKSLNYLNELGVKTNNYNTAYNYQKAYYQLKDSINGIEIQKQITILDKKYQVEKKEKEILRLESQHKIQEAKNNTLKILISSLLFLIVLATYFVYQKRKKENAIAKLKLERTQFKKKQLEQELEYKNKQLTSHAINIMQRNELLKNYLTILKNATTDSTNPKSSSEIKSLKREINRTLQSKKDWESFKTYFEETNKDFVDKLTQYNPNLTNNDFRLAALIKLGMTNKEIASIFNISSQSVKNGLYRLKKKMQIADSENLRSFLKNL